MVGLLDFALSLAEYRYQREEQTIPLGYSSVDVGLTEKFSIIEKLKQSYSTLKLCRIFGVHRSSYKYWLERPKVISAHEVRVRALVQEAHNVSNGSAGARTIADIVTNMGMNLSRYRATKVMKVLGLVSLQQPKHKYRKEPLEHVEIPNHLERQFAVTAPNQVWGGG